MKYSTLSKRAAVFVAMLTTAISLLACALGGGTVTVIGTETPANNPTVVSTFTPHVAKTDTILDAEGHATLLDNSIGLVRFTGSYHTWSQKISAPTSEQAATLTTLQLTIVTGNDDLRYCWSANIVVHFATAGDQSYSACGINVSGSFNNGGTATFPLSPIPPATTVGDIQSLAIVTSFAGGLSGDNWDVVSVKLGATFLA